MRDLRGMSGPFGAGRGRNGCASGVGRREGAKWLPEGCLPLQAGVTRGRSPAKVSAWVDFTLHQCKIYPAFGPRKGPCQPRGPVVILGAMKGPRKPLAKIEGRKRMQQSGLTVAWHGTRSRKDWAAYVENGSEQGRLVLAEQVSERAVKSLLAKIQSLSRDALEAMGRPVEAVAAQGGGPPPRRPRGGGEARSSSDIIVQGLPGRQRAPSGAMEAAPPAIASPRRRRLPAKIERSPSAETRRPARVSARDLAGTVRQLRSRLEGLEEEHEELLCDRALLRRDAGGHEG